jgi:FixJ family two-component response regulator
MLETSNSLRHEPTTQETAMKLQAQTSEPWVAIVEDDPSVRIALARLLRTESICVETFGSALEFLDACIGSTGQPTRGARCLVLDIHLGSVSGFELYDRLIALHSAMPVILMTAHDEVPTSELSRRGGPYGYLRKPFAGDALVQLVRSALERSACESW